MTEPNANVNIEERIATLTATVDQLQAERDRESYVNAFLLVAVACLAMLLIIQHRRLLKLTPLS